MGTGFPFVWANGQILSREEFDRSFGAVRSASLGVFETFLWNRGGVKRFERHLARLQRGVLALGGAPFYWSVAETLAALLRRNGVAEAVCRFEVQREGSFAFLRPRPAPPSGEVKVCIASTPLGDPGLTGNHKTNRRESYDRALGEARELGDFEALLLNREGSVCEGSRTSLFVATENGVVTPGLECGVVAGVVREWVLELPQAPSCVRALAPEELFGAREVILTNAVRGVLGVSGLRHGDRLRTGLPGFEGPVARAWAERWNRLPPLDPPGGDLKLRRTRA
jgi:branched-subunit amino acid aminotransferase/4-amino-4-deoxychorismate lyase